MSQDLGYMDMSVFELRTSEEALDPVLDVVCTACDDKVVDTLAAGHDLGNTFDSLKAHLDWDHPDD